MNSSSSLCDLDYAQGLSEKHRSKLKVQNEVFPWQVLGENYDTLNL